MRFAVIANVQGNLSALRAVLADIDARGPKIERIVCAGDLVGLGPNPNEVVDVVRGRDIEVVRGNYDDAVAFDRIGSGTDHPDQTSEEADRRAVQWTRNRLTESNLAFLRSLPRDLRLLRAASGVQVKREAQDERTAEYRRTFFVRAIFGGLYRPPPNISRRVLVVHGSPRALIEYVRSDTANSILAAIAGDAQTDVLVSGHAGIDFQRTWSGVTFVGAGSVSGPQTPPGRADYAIVQVRDEVETDFPQVTYDPDEYLSGLREYDLPPAVDLPFSGLGR